MFLTKEALTQLQGSKSEPAEKREKTKRALAAYEDRDSGRKDLIANAVSLHRSRQEVLSELDEESRRKLSEMAQTMMPVPQKNPEPEPEKPNEKRRLKWQFWRKT